MVQAANSPTEDASNTYVFETYSDRDRLYVQFELIKDVFDRKLKQTLAKADLSTDPARANWRLLDAGCGEGLFSAEIVRQFPHSEVVGFDRDSEAVMTASVYASPLGQAQFFTHDILKPLPTTFEDTTGNNAAGRNFDVAIAWLILMHVKPVEQAITNLKDALKPGGVILVHDGPENWATFPHPSFNLLMNLLTRAGKYISSFEFAERHGEYLEKAGFVDIHTERLEGTLGGKTPLGQKGFSHMVATFESARPGLVDKLRMISGPEFDEHIRRIKTECTTDQEGYGSSILTIARKPF